MKIDVLTLFPDMFTGFLQSSMVAVAIKKEKISVDLVDIRKYSKDKHKKVDDYPYGGGGGMVMTPDPIANALKAINYSLADQVIYLTPQGRRLEQNDLHRLKKLERIVILCGHYKEIDQRIRDKYITKEYSIGDYVLSGGEVPAMVLIDGLGRLQESVLGNKCSAETDSFENGLLGYPMYTRPRIFEDMSVPEVLLNGNHSEIKKWQYEKSQELTKRERKNLVDKK